MAPRRPQIPSHALYVQHTNRDPNYNFLVRAYALRCELSQSHDRPTSVIQNRLDKSKFALPYPTPEALSRVLADRTLDATLQKTGFKRIEPNNNSFERNKRTVHIKNLDSNFFFRVLDNEKTVDECKAAFQTELQQKLGSMKIEHIHVLGHEHHGASALPSSVQILFDTIENAQAFCDSDTTLNLGWIPASSKKMHHNISKDICGICRVRNCNSGTSKCDKKQRCSRCLNENHTFINCDQGARCRNCNISGHVTNSDRCPKNREYIKNKISRIDAHRQNNLMLNGDAHAMGRAINTLQRTQNNIQRTFNAWSRPNNNRFPRPNSRGPRSHSRGPRSQSRGARSQSGHRQTRLNPIDQDRFPTLSNNANNAPRQFSQQRPQVAAPQTATPQTAPSQAAPRQNISHTPIPNRDPRLAQPVTIPDSGKPVCTAAWGQCLMYSAIMSKAKNYCLPTFHRSVDYFFENNGYKKLKFLEPDRVQLDYFASGCGNFRPMTESMAISQPNEFTSTPNGDIIPSQTSQIAPSPLSSPSRSLASTSLAGSPISPATPNPSTAESAPTNSNATSPVLTLPNLHNINNNSCNSSDSENSILNFLDHPQTRIIPESPNTSPIRPGTQELFGNSQNQSSTPLNSQSMTLAFSPTQPDNTPFTTVTSKPKKSGKKFFIPFNSEYIDCDSRFNTSLYLNRYPNCCNKDATLHKKKKHNPY